MRPSVVVVSEDDNEREALVALLEPQFSVVSAKDGPSTLDVINRRRVDVVLLNVRLPKMHGLEVLTRLKVMQPLTEVVLLTTVADVDIAVTGTKIGAAGFITKPYEDATVIDVIKQCLSRRDATVARVLLVGSKPETLALFEVLLSLRVSTLATSASRALNADFGEGTPALVILDARGVASDQGEGPARLPEELRALQRRFSRSATMVLIADDDNAQEKPLFALGVSDTATMSPGRLNEAFERVAVALALAGGPRVSWPRIPRGILHALNYIADRCHDSLSVGDIARVADVAPRRLGRAFRQILGMTLPEFLRRLRVAMSRYLLAETTQPIEEIAQAAGFTHASHLSRVFTSSRGIRPGEYRRRMALMLAPHPPIETGVGEPQVTWAPVASLEATDVEERRAMIADRIRAGVLPKQLPGFARLRPIPHRRFGVSEGTMCSGCDRPIKQGQMMSDYSYATGRVFCFHEECEQLWNAERQGVTS